jgi:hypothetical protein
VDDLRPRPGAALDYIFWKFHTGELAFLVDVILRRREGTAETRVSMWLGDRPRLERSVATEWTEDSSGITTEHANVTALGSTGSVGDIEWDLTWDPGSALIAPMPLGLDAALRPFDMTLRVRPTAIFQGTVTIGGTRFPVVAEPGVVMHYWGRQLASQWLWVSASNFAGDSRRRVEIEVARTRLWGRLPVPTEISYVWLCDETGEELIVSPLNGIITTRHVGSSWIVRAVGMRGRRHTIVLDAGTARANDLGESISQTLRGRLSVDGVEAIAGTVGVETRNWQL